MPIEDRDYVRQRQRHHPPNCTCFNCNEGVARRFHLRIRPSSGPARPGPVRSDKNRPPARHGRESGKAVLFLLIAAVALTVYAIYLGDRVQSAYAAAPGSGFSDLAGMVWREASAPLVRSLEWLSVSGGAEN